MKRIDREKFVLASLKILIAITMILLLALLNGALGIL